LGRKRLWGLSKNQVITETMMAANEEFTIRGRFFLNEQDPVIEEGCDEADQCESLEDEHA
jgi:hypothetical protein